MFELMVGTDAVQRRTNGSLNRPPKRTGGIRRAAVRMTTAAALRALADRVEPVGARRAPEAAGASPR